MREKWSYHYQSGMTYLQQIHYLHAWSGFLLLLIHNLVQSLLCIQKHNINSRFFHKIWSSKLIVSSIKVKLHTAPDFQHKQYLQFYVLFFSSLHLMHLLSFHLLLWDAKNKPKCQNKDSNWRGKRVGEVDSLSQEWNSNLIANYHFLEFVPLLLQLLNLSFKSSCFLSFLKKEGTVTSKLWQMISLQ